MVWAFFVGDQMHEEFTRTSLKMTEGESIAEKGDIARDQEKTIFTTEARRRGENL